MTKQSHLYQTQRADIAGELQNTIFQYDSSQTPPRKGITVERFLAGKRTGKRMVNGLHC